MPAVSQGTIYRRNGSKNWSIKFYVDGDHKRETSGSENRQVALDFLSRRIDDAARGRYVDIDRRITFDEMRGLLLQNYEFKRNRSDPAPHLNRLPLVADRVSQGRYAGATASRLPTDRGA